MDGLQMKYFVLKPKAKANVFDPYAKASRVAMLAYANAITNENPALANELRVWVEKEEGFLTDGGGA